jgi:hypothetical protein
MGVEAASGSDGPAIQQRNLSVARDDANKKPRSEGDQTLKDGWPLYRSERSQVAFNDAMATLKATDQAAPGEAIFKDCAALGCLLILPRIDADGWIPAGRLWVAPRSYVLFVHSPRLAPGQRYPRRTMMGMRYFVFHEFHNSTRNVDVYDTIGSHRSSVFVPFYMSKPATDARGNQFVVVVQVAPWDVVSIHASNLSSAGPGIEVAKNVTDALDPLQASAGVLTALMVTASAPRLSVVNHRGSEGQAMLRAYEVQRRTSRGSAQAPLTLPFVPAAPKTIAAASAELGALIRRKGVSTPLALAERAIIPPRQPTAIPEPASNSGEAPRLLTPVRLAARPERPTDQPAPVPLIATPISRAAAFAVDVQPTPQLISAPAPAWRPPAGLGATIR